MRLPPKTARWKRCVPRLALINVWISKGFYLHSLHLHLVGAEVFRPVQAFRHGAAFDPKSGHAKLGRLYCWRQDATGLRIEARLCRLTLRLVFRRTECGRSVGPT